MRRRLLRSAAVVCLVAWSNRALGCDPSSTTSEIVDTDGDGISDTDEKYLYGTSPVLADTDGDGMTDYAEIVLNAFDPTNAPLHFNPRVADVPELEVLIVGPPLISIRLTESNGETRTFETSHTSEVTVGVADSTTQTTTQSETVGQSVTREIAREVGISNSDGERRVVRDAGADAGNTVVEDPGGPVAVTLTNANAVSSTAERSNTAEVSVSLTHEESREVREAVTRAESYAQSHDISASGGRLALMALIVNRGNLPFRVTNLILSASLVTEDGIEYPVGNLDIITVFTNFVPYSLAPGEQQGPVVFDKDTLNLDVMAALLRNLQGLIVRVGVYELSDANGKPYAFDVGAIRGRTATVSIDYGSRRPRERHLIATNLDPASPGVDARRALHEILHIPVQCDPDNGVTSVRDVVADKSGGGHWIVYHRHENGSNVMRTSYAAPYDFSGIILRAGDVLRLIWVEK